MVSVGYSRNDGRRRRLPSPRRARLYSRRRHRPRRGDGQPQGGWTAHQGDSEPHALAGHDRWREPPRPTHAPLYGARHDRGRVPRGQASERSLTQCPPITKEESEEESLGFVRSRYRGLLRRCGLRTGGRRRSAPAGRREGRAGQTTGEGRARKRQTAGEEGARKGEATSRTGRRESQEGDRARSAKGEKAGGR